MNLEMASTMFAAFAASSGVAFIEAVPCDPNRSRWQGDFATSSGVAFIEALSSGLA